VGKAVGFSGRGHKKNENLMEGVTQKHSSSLKKNKSYFV
jgi:hypothetical protein